MGRPVVKSFGARSFLDGSDVYENDAQIRGQIEGNIELSDIRHSKSQYNMTIGPVYYGPDSTVVTAGYSVDWETPGAAICVFRAPRDMTVTRLQVHLTSLVLLGADDQFIVKVQSLAEDDAIDGPRGAYKQGTWTSGPFIVVTGATTTYGGTSVFSNSYPEGTYIRVFLEGNDAGGGTANKNRPQAEVIVTLTIEEDHAE